jgi:nitrate reductase gamma subunit
MMKDPTPKPNLFARPPKSLFDEEEDGFDARAVGPLFPRPVLRVLVGVFCVFAMLTVEWFGLLLLNSENVVASIGALNTLRVIAVLMGGIALPSALLMLHYRRLYSYTSDENVFFAITFSLSFLMGTPCALVGVFA